VKKLFQSFSWLSLKKLPWEQRTRAQKQRFIVRIAAFCLMGIIMLGSLSHFGYQSYQKYAARKAYEELLAKITPKPTLAPTPTPRPTATPGVKITLEPTPEPTPDLRPTSDPAPPEFVTELMAEYPDVAAFLDVPGTRIRYPVVQGPHNDYYLDRLYNGRVNGAGSLFLDTYHTKDFTGQNCIIYGHRRTDGSMFFDLEQYAEPEFARMHQRITLTLPDRVVNCRVFAASVVGAYFDYRHPEYQPESAFNAYIDRIMQQDYAQLGTPLPYYGQSILGLSTCNFFIKGQDTRFVVFCVIDEEAY